MEAAHKLSFVVPIVMTSKNHRQAAKRPRPVFFNAAIRRMARQASWRQKLKAASTISSFVLSDVLWWLREGIWHIPSTVSAARNCYTIHLLPEENAPSIDVYTPPNTEQFIKARLSQGNETSASNSSFSKPIVLYVHGGAWGSGHSSHYSQIAMRIVEATESPVLVLTYRLYPTALISDQADDVKTALLRIRGAFPSQKVVVFAHSSGAHITSLALLQEAKKNSETTLADVIILTAGPFHLMHHFLFESHRGVALVSPMLPAASAEEDHTQFDKWSPTVIAERFSTTLIESSSFSLPALEGNLASKNVYLPEVACVSKGVPFPKTFVMTSTCDTVVPMYSSIRFSAALRRLGLSAELLVYDFVTHTDYVLDWSKGAKPRDRSEILDVEHMDPERRKACVSHLGGEGMAALMNHEEQAIGTCAHVRDILRIINALSVDSDKKNMTDVVGSV